MCNKANAVNDGPPSQTPAVELVAADLGYDGRPVLREVSLQIALGECVAILGANGAGKTTLVRSILGLLPVVSGEVLIHGQPTGSFRDWPRVAYVPQFLPELGSVPVSVAEYVGAGLPGGVLTQVRHYRQRHAQVFDALAQVELTHKAAERLDSLSGGQRRRAMIARALVGSADTFVLDEPTAGVDQKNQIHLVTAMGKIRERGGTILVVAHDLAYIAPRLSRVLVVDQAAPGGISYDGPPDPQLVPIDDDPPHHLEEGE